MNFLIADTFTDSLARLTSTEQKAVKTSAFDLQVNPANPGLKLHRLDRARDKNFWTVRAGLDLRIVVHRSESVLVLCYVGHHDKAYAWAERRRLETHPKTGAAQIVEIRERIEEIVVPRYVEKPPCAEFTADQLASWGIPEDWIEDVRSADADGLLRIAERLPVEASEALLEIATGGTPKSPSSVAPGRDGTADEDPFSHPAAQRRFRIVEDVEELERALDFPWDRWMVFLHPDQRWIVENNWSGPARVKGAAGTGKTVVAVHRAVFLARHNGTARVLLTTFSDVLGGYLREQVMRLAGNEPRIRERIDVISIDEVASRLAGTPKIAAASDVADAIRTVLHGTGSNHSWISDTFVTDEWNHVVDNHAIRSWEAYQDFRRLGRKKRLAENRRRELWDVVVAIRDRLNAQGLSTWGSVYSDLIRDFEHGRAAPYNHVVADESQDISPVQLRFLKALVGTGENGLFFAGDTGQRIFRQPFSWTQLGIDVRGRSRILRVNYRTSHQIRVSADRLLDSSITDPDGNAEPRDETVSVFNGPHPDISVCASQQEETDRVARWIRDRIADGVQPHSIGVIVRSDDESERAVGAVTAAIGEEVDSRAAPQIVTMHAAKGLEFSAVAVMACDDTVIPSMARIESVGDEGDLEEVYTTERHLLYVACTRARDRLLVTGVDPASEFLDDMGGL